MRVVVLILVALSVIGVPAQVALAGDLPLSTICIEARTGLILTQSNAGMVRPPASMVKMMLFYLVAEGLEEGTWNTQTPIEITPHAESIGGTQLYLEAGEVWTLGDLMQGIAVASANDAAMAVAEGLWGSKDAYLEAANAKAKELGLVQTVVRSVHGLPPDRGELPDETTARDMAVLAQWCVLSPQIMQWAGCREWTPPGEETARQNTNKLLYQLEGCDGLKTGYIRAAGFCLTATVLRDEVRLIAVVMGCSSNNERFAQTQAVLDAAFANVERVQAVAQGEEVAPVAVDNCETLNMPLRAAEDVWVVVPRADRNRIELRVEAPERVVPPIVAGHELGQALIYLDDRPLGKTALVAPMDLQPAGWTWKLRQSVSGWLQPSVTAGR